MKVISLGWGVQSFTLAAMVALGELEPVDAAVHSDTTHEASWTYDFARRWTPWLEQRGVRVVTVQPTRTDPVDNGHGWPDPPYFSQSNKGNGQIKRQCTGAWKIMPQRRWIQANRNGKPVEQWLGISLDEFQRMKDSSVRYITNRWPLIERRMTRADCVAWLEARGLEVPQKSACYFCPFHSTREWRALQTSGNGDWKKAVEIDAAIRNIRSQYYDLYLHPSRRPLDEVDFRSEVEKGQMTLWDQECEGVCGI
jgi:hypothetical protein